MRDDLRRGDAERMFGVDAGEYPGEPPAWLDDAPPIDEADVPAVDIDDRSRVELSRRRDIHAPEPLDFARLLEPVARKLWGAPNPRLSKANELRWGNNGARVAYLDSGQFSDNESKVSGGTLALIMHVEGGEKAGALKWLEQHGFKDSTSIQLGKPLQRSCSTFYDYDDADGVTAYLVERRQLDGGKTFLQHGPNGRGGFHCTTGCMKGVQPLPYRLPALQVADLQHLVYIVEGEKDADRLASLGLVATTNSGGAGNFKAELAQYFSARRVVIIADNDEAGRKHAADVAAKLKGHVAGVGILNLPGLSEKEDVSNWLDCGGTIDELDRLGALALAEASEPSQTTGDPVNLWARYDPPVLPRGLLPEAIEEFARIQGESIGVEAGGIAMAALTVCAAAIPDAIKLRVKRHDPHWMESARIWTALIGPPSAKKSPILNTASRPLCRIDAQLFRSYERERAIYDALPTDERKATPAPKQTRIRLEDTTIEAAQEVFRDSPDGLLVLQDEMSGWFGAMDKYNSAKGAAKDRGFWLQAFNGGQYALNRVGRGNTLIENLSASILGGIQPEPIRALVGEAHDDGLIQRLFPIVLHPARMGKDEPTPDVVGAYDRLVESLHRLATPIDRDGNVTDIGLVTLRFDDGAQAIRARLEERHLVLMQTELINRKLASHIGKYDGLFARLCVLWHCIEHAGTGYLPEFVTAATAERVGEFLHFFLLRHAIAFYGGVLGLSDNHEELADVAGYILAHELQVISMRDLQRGSKSMRAMTRDGGRKIFEQLEAFGWLEEARAVRTDAPRWSVAPSVHRLYAERGRMEQARRQSAREIIAGLAKAE